MTRDEETAERDETKEPAPCLCIEQTNDALQEKYPGVRLKTATLLPSLKRRVALATFRESGRGKTPVIYSTFCPFCGIKYSD